MKKVGIYIDGANIFYKSTENDNRIDFRKLRDWLIGTDNFVVGMYFNSKISPVTDSKKKFHEHVRLTGFELILRPMLKKKPGARIEQDAVDVSLAIEAMKRMQYIDKMIIVSGDSDFMPLIEEAQKQGKEVEVVSYKYCLHPEYKKLPHRLIDEFLKK